MTRVRYVALIVVLMTSTGCFLFHPVSPLAAAARAGDLTALDNLVAQGADINAGTGVNGWPPVLHAIHKGQTAALVRLLDHGASLSGATGREALLMSSGYGNEPMVRVLLAHGINPRDDGRSGAFVLSEAVRWLARHRLQLARLPAPHRRRPRAARPRSWPEARRLARCADRAHARPRRRVR